MYHYPKGSVLSVFEDSGNVIEKTVTSSDAMSLGDFLEIFNLQNHVSFPTHDKGNTLDLILADVNNKVVREVSQGDFTSDHCFIDCRLDVCKTLKETQCSQCHNIKNGQREIPKRTSESVFIHAYRNNN